MNTARLLEQEPSAEKVHGQFEVVSLPAVHYAKMSQVRGEKNRISEELKQSILEEGLINPIDVARMDGISLLTYIEFVNDIWGSKTNIEEFAEQRQPDGTYFLVIAGHSRHQAIIELEQEGKLPVWPLLAKVHNVSSPEDIIAIQLAENVHSQPPRERRAIAIVETYEWGLRSGKWSNQKEFLEMHDGVGKTSLSEALGFSHLPLQVRSFVLGGHLSYNAGLELGKAAADARAYLRFKAGFGATEQTIGYDTILEKALLQRLVVKTNHVANSKMNSIAAEKYIRSWRIGMVNEMERAQLSEEERSQMLDTLEADLGLMTHDELLEIQITADRREIAAFASLYSKRPAQEAADLLLLNAEFLSSVLIEKTQKDFEQALLDARHKVGEVVAKRTIKHENTDNFDDVWGQAPGTWSAPPEF